jgi:choice-of-anchor B domain-containing protein
MRLLSGIIIFLGLFGAVQAQEIPLNTRLLAHIPLPEDGSGIWGYEDRNGIPYAVIGGFNQAWVYSVEDPENPILRHKAPGFPSIWREIRGYGDYIYVVNDRGADGLLIIDMTKAPDTITHQFYTPQITVNNTTRNLGRCHTIFIDEKGYLYLMGCNISRGGVLIFDLNEDPVEPPFLGYADLEYSHDAFARGDTLWSAEILAGFFAVYDVSDRTQPKLLARQVTSRAFTHNVWPSDDGKYLFSTDERSNAFVDSYDVSDLNNIKLLDKYRTLATENTGVIPHNTYYHNGFLVTSYYTDGIRVIDAHRPDNLVEVAHYDTWNDPYRCHSGFFGCWGVFPYTGDRNIVYASDINNGLFIIEVDYKRACYLEGSVKDANGVPVANARVRILSDQINRKFTDPSGLFKTGQVLAGTFKVEVMHPDFHTGYYTVELQNGEVTTLEAVLFRRRPVQFSAVSRDEAGKPVEARIYLSNESNVYELDFDNAGKVNTVLLSGKYVMNAGSWGYQALYSEDFEVLDENFSTGFVFKEGYEDNFENDLGWDVQSTPTMVGAWTRAVPRGTEYLGDPASPAMDDPDDDGDFAYVTGNWFPGAACGDLMNGTTTLTSPWMDLSKMQEPAFNYSVWYFSNKLIDSDLNDMLIKVQSKNKVQLIQRINSNTNGWEKVRNVLVKDFVELSDSVRLIIEVGDLNNVRNITEAGFDHFFVTETAEPSNTQEGFTYSGWSISPNPGDTYLNIHHMGEVQIAQDITVRNMQGMVVYRNTIHDSDFNINTEAWAPGLYSIRIGGDKILKWIKL